MAPSFVTTVDPPHALAFDPSGTFLYVSNAGAAGILTYTVSAMSSGGELTPTGGAGFGITVIAP